MTPQALARRAAYNDAFAEVAAVRASLFNGEWPQALVRRPEWQDPGPRGPAFQRARAALARAWHSMQVEGDGGAQWRAVLRRIKAGDVPA